MTRKIKIRDNAALDSILAANKAWLSSLTDGDRDRVSKEISDLIYHGQIMADQGAAFTSRRTFTIGDETVVLDARFGQKSILRRMIGLFGG